MTEHFDVIVVGSGPGGASLAHALAPTGNLDCRAHEIDNLYVADASFFPSIGAVNPTLIIIANALRVADISRERL